MNFILSYIYPHKSKFINAFIFKFIGTILELLIPFILAFVIDDVVPLGEINQILFWGAVMILLAVLGCLIGMQANRLTTYAAVLFALDLRNDVVTKVFSLSNRQIDKLTVPSIISRVTTDTAQLHQFVSVTQRMGARAPILLLGSIVMSFLLDKRIAMVMVAILPILVFIVVYTTIKGIPLFDEARKSVDRLTLILRENIFGAKIVKALCKEDYEISKFNDCNQENKDNNEKAESLMAATNPLITLALNLGMVVVLLFGAYLVAGGTAKPGVLITFLTYFSIIVTALLTVTRAFISASKSIACANRLEEILNLEDDMVIEDVKDVNNYVNYENNENHVEFKNVTFSYLGKVNNLTDISFSLKKGETLGIIGGIGTGKSTIINLLMKFYDVDHGDIYINGKNIKSISFEEISNEIGIVFQRDLLQSKTIKDNILFGREASDESLIKASRDAGALEFIEKKPEGMHYEVASMGKNLSGGQRQRLLIARALLSKPKIIILDDASSALDYQTDAKLRKILSEEYNDSTKIIITGRINSIKNAENIIVLEDGKIIGQGTHEELLKACSSYEEIFLSQGGEAIGS